MRSIRNVNAVAAVRSETTSAIFWLGFLLSILGALAYESSLSFGPTAAPAIPGTILLVIWFYRIGLIRR